ncbi:MAG: bifunctional riboflavin kinase/FAD synthetase [Bacilli bacterium]|nr:bifunctional riboflavin kinase/FAD synthetase [Bacilli bacterium]
MKTILLDYKKPTERFDALSICLGYFDGVHLGHQALIKYARKNAKYILGLLTFSKPISTIVDNGKSKEVLTSLDDRFKIISKLGVDYYFVTQVDEEFTKLSDLDFIEMLRKMNVKEIFVGKDFRYGAKAAGTISTLKDYFDVNVIDIENVDGEKVSTQRIDNLLLDGDIKKANDLLGHNYSVVGTIVEGRHIGTEIGFPTLNLQLSDNYILPRFGVYKTICYVDNVPHISITNVGIKPTVSNEEKPGIEVHLKDFKGEIKGDVIILEFLKFIRPEIKFSSLEELKAQIADDVKEVF